MRRAVRNAAYRRRMCAQGRHLASLKVDPVHSAVDPACVCDVVIVAEANTQYPGPVLILVEQMRLARAAGDIVGVQEIVPGRYQKLCRRGGRKSESGNRVARRW